MRKLIENFFAKFQGALLVIGYVYHNSGLFCAFYIHTAIPKKSILHTYSNKYRWALTKSKKKKNEHFMATIPLDFSQSIWSIFKKNYLS